MKSSVGNTEYLGFAVKGRLLAVLTLLAIAAVAANVVRAQAQGGGASISGIITDATGGAIPKCIP